ncbi:MAG: hypothetical protein V7749_17655 [Cocleimonas sp.]
MKLVSLNIQINAWLDCSHPFISLHNKNDGDLMAYFNADKINSLIDGGEITVEELQSNSLDSQIETISTLLTIKQQDAIYRRLQDTRFVIKQTDKEVNNHTQNNVQSIRDKEPSDDILFPFLGLSTA